MPEHIIHYTVFVDMNTWLFCSHSPLLFVIELRMIDFTFVLGCRQIAAVYNADS